MNQHTDPLKRALDTVAAEIRRRIPRAKPWGKPFLVAIDGESGAGKSTLSTALANEFAAALVQSDDFFAANVTDADWDARTPAQRASDGIDWRRLRSEALDPLLAGRPALWRAFDFAAGTQPDGTYPMQSAWTRVEPAPIIILDGAFSCRPELAGLVDLSVFVVLPLEVRLRRMAARDDPDWLAAWHQRWDAAFEHYFTHVRPSTSFDLVVDLNPSGT